MCLLEGHLAGPFDDGLPDLLSESLVSIRGSHQFVSYPGFSDIFLGLNSIVNVPVTARASYWASTPGARNAGGRNAGGGNVE